MELLFSASFYLSLFIDGEKKTRGMVEETETASKLENMQPRRTARKEEKLLEKEPHAGCVCAWISFSSWKMDRWHKRHVKYGDGLYGGAWQRKRKNSKKKLFY